MKVIHCLNHYLPNHIAGTEVYVSALARELKSLGTKSTIVIPNYGSTKDERYLFEGTEVILYGEPSKPDRELIRGTKYPEGLRNFLAILAKEQPDIINFHELAGSNGISLIHVKKARAMGFKIIMTFHIAKYSCKTGTLMYKNGIPWDGVIRKIRCSKCWLHDKKIKGVPAELIVAGFTFADAFHLDTQQWNNSLGTAMAFPKLIEKLKNELAELEKNTDAFIVIAQWYKAILLRNNISPAHIHLITQALPHKQGLGTEEFSHIKKLHLIFIGRISSFKGVLLLIKAVKMLRKEDIHLNIYGNPTEKEYMEQCLTEAEGLDNISFKGSCPPDKVIFTISRHHILCLPSEVCEMAPLVIQEAFAAGIPVIASDVYGNAEQIKHGINGWLFKLKDQRDLAGKLQHLIDHPELIELTKKNIPTPQKFDAVAGEYVQIYNTVLA